MVLLSSMAEGLVIFAGHGNPYAHKLPDMVAMAVKVATNLVDTATPEMIHSLRDEWVDVPFNTLWMPASLRDS